MGHAHVEQRFTRFRLCLVVLGETAEAVPPGKGALDNPAMVLNRKGSFGLRIGARHDCQVPAHLLRQVVDEWPGVA